MGRIDTTNWGNAATTRSHPQMPCTGSRGPVYRELISPTPTFPASAHASRRLGVAGLTGNTRRSMPERTGHGARPMAALTVPLDLFAPQLPPTGGLTDSQSPPR